MFENRTEAGERLADALLDRGVSADVVLAIPRGALPVARPVADALDAPLDVIVASKIGAPTNPELAVGAVASDGSVWYNDDVISHLNVTDTYLERARREETDAAREKLERYRDGDDPPDLGGKCVVVVDDGLATGATARACLRQVSEAGASDVVLAVPVGAPDSLAAIEAAVDEVVALERPPRFGAVGQFYRSFDQVSDEEAIAYLER